MMWRWCSPDLSFEVTLSVGRCSREHAGGCSSAISHRLGDTRSSAGSGRTTVGYRGACGPQAEFRIAMELPLDDTRTELGGLVMTEIGALEPVGEGCGRQRPGWEVR